MLDRKYPNGRSAPAPAISNQSSGQDELLEFSGTKGSEIDGLAGTGLVGTVAGTVVALVDEDTDVVAGIGGIGLVVVARGCWAAGLAGVVEAGMACEAVGRNGAVVVEAGGRPLAAPVLWANADDAKSISKMTERPENVFIETV